MYVELKEQKAFWFDFMSYFKDAIKTFFFNFQLLKTYVFHN